MVKQVNDFEEFKKIIGDKSKKVVVDFTATWCGPCQAIAPKFVEMAEENKELEFIKVDVDENGEAAEHCEVEAMPTFIFFNAGEKFATLVGASEADLKGKIAELKAK